MNPEKNFPVCKLIIGKLVFFCLAPEQLKERKTVKKIF